MTKTIINYNNDQCGAGKTHAIIESFVTRPGRYVYALDRISEVGPRREWIVAMAKELGVSCPSLHVIHGQTGSSVAKDIELAPSYLNGQSHVVLVITHEGLKIADHSGYAGWEIVIDEDPCISTIEAWTVPVSRHALAANYDLIPTSSGAYEIMPKAERATLSEWREDSLAGEGATLERRLQSGPVYTAKANWADVNKRLTWWTLWHPSALASYSRITIMANNFESKITYHVLTKMFADHYELRPFTLAKTRPFKPRPVRVEYFANNHQASRFGFTVRPEGKAFLRRVINHVNTATRPDNHLYCWNSYQVGNIGLTLNGTGVTAKISGSNAFQHITDCTILYSAKASKEEKAVYQDFHVGVDYDAVQADREFEDIIQVTMRTSLRVPDDVRPVTIRVYDRSQADMLGDYLTRHYAYPVDIVHIDVGGNDYRPMKAGRPPKAGVAKSGAERAREYRSRKKLAGVAKVTA